MQDEKHIFTGDAVEVEINFSHDLITLRPRMVELSIETYEEIDKIYQEEIQGKIEEVDAVDSRNYVDNVTIREEINSDNQRTSFITSPEAESYSDIVEEGRHANASGRGGYPGRFPVALAVSAAEGRIVSVLDRMVEEL